MADTSGLGLALARIRDRALYRERFTTFEEYYRATWQCKKSHIYRLIGAAQAFALLSLLQIKISPQETHIGLFTATPPRGLL